MFILIPAYEPDERLITLVNELTRKSVGWILVVDDGSGPEYQEIFHKVEKMGTTVLHHPKNCGKGAALKTGFLYLKKMGIHDIIVTADSDGQHRADDILRVGQRAKNLNQLGRSTMVLGSRHFVGDIPLRSKFGNRLTRTLFRAGTGIDLPDTQTGLRAFSSHIFAWLLEVEGDRFEYEFHMLLEAKAAGIELVPMEIRTIYENGNESSHFRPIRDSLRIYLPLMRFFASSMSAGVLDFLLLFLFQALSGSLFVGVVLARVVSSVYNYFMNHYLVFRNHHVSKKQSALRYFGLVVLIMFLNYGLIAFMTYGLMIPELAAKIIAEIALFLLSYTVQKSFVFRKKNRVNMNFTRI